MRPYDNNLCYTIDRTPKDKNAKQEWVNQGRYYDNLQAAMKETLRLMEINDGAVITVNQNDFNSFKRQYEKWFKEIETEVIK